MSTYYATFADHQRAKDALRELLRGGVRPDDASLLLPGDSASDAQDLTANASVGDASFRVGRADDPVGSLDQDDPLDEMTTISQSAVSGIDTSNAAYTGDSIDQMDDSQSVAEDTLYPYREISQSEHEMDDLALTVTSGFPTPVPMIDDIKDGDEMQDQNQEAMEALDVPGFGAALGNGALATAASGTATSRRGSTTSSRTTAFPRPPRTTSSPRFARARGSSPSSPLRVRSMNRPSRRSPSATAAPTAASSTRRASTTTTHTRHKILFTRLGLYA